MLHDAGVPFHLPSCQSMLVKGRSRQEKHLIICLISRSSNPDRTKRFKLIISMPEVCVHTGGTGKNRGQIETVGLAG